MNRLKNKLRLIVALTTILMVAATPILQAHQSDDHCNTGYESCGCGCSCGQVEAPLSKADMLEDVCCCNVSTPAPTTPPPLDAQLRPTINPDIFITVMSVTSQITVVEIQLYQAARTGQRLAHGPPLYVLNASYLI
ncbi:MAG: hypothetical protein KOO62_12735 [candidate division Zixibacteria bacterium]|nr:hypothetical protein [candidate division Zixibacteria bacterium]